MIRTTAVVLVVALVAVAVVVIASPAASALDEPSAAGPAMVRSGPDRGCPVPVGEPQRGRRTGIDVAFCAVLGRRPSTAEALDWARRLERGAGFHQLMTDLATSREFRRTSTLSLGESLAGLAPLTAPDPAAATGDDDERPAVDESPNGSVDVEPSAPAVADGDAFRARRPMTTARFDRLAAERLMGATTVGSGIVHGTLERPGQRINVALVHLSRAEVRVSPGDRAPSTVGSWAREIGGKVAVNGNWYGPWDGPAVAGGRAYGGTDHGYTSLFGFTADGDSVVAHHQEVNEGVDPRIVEGVSGHPTLVHRGAVTTDFGGDPTFIYRHPRTAIGLDATGDVLILVTVDGRSSGAGGMTGAETATLMADLGAFDAVMLDGGGSTTMWLADRGVVNQPSGSLRSVGNQLAIVER